MNPLRRLGCCVLGVLQRRRVEQEMQEEMQHHLDMEIERNVKNGLRREEASLVARKRFGNLGSLQVRSREERPVFTIEQWARDFYGSIRSLSKARWFSSSVITTFALCVGVLTLVYSALFAFVLRPLPFEEADRIVQVFNIGKNNPPDGVSSGSSWNQYQDYRNNLDQLAAIAAAKPLVKIFRERSKSEKWKGLGVSAEFFELFRVEPVLGRFFEESEVEPVGEKLVILGEDVWKHRFGADPSVIGRTIRFDDGDLFTIVGVAPRSLAALDAEVRFFVPYEVNPRAKRYGDGANLWLRMTSSQNHGSTRDQLRAYERRWYQDVADLPQRNHFEENFERLELGLPHPLKRSLMLLQAGAMVVFLVGSLNILNLYLGRVEQRARELSIRSAIGAGMGALRRLMIAESSILIGAGLVGGLLLAHVGIRLVNDSLIASDPTAQPVILNLSVIGTVGLLSIAIAALIGTIPLQLLQRRGKFERIGVSLRGVTRGKLSFRLRQLLVIGQVTGAVVLLIVAGLLSQSLNNVLAVDPGFAANQVVRFRIDYESTAAFYDRAKTAELKQRVLTGMREIPGVEDVGIAQYEAFLPYNSENTRNVMVRGDAQGDTRRVVRHLVTPSYFSTLSIPLVDGRFFDSGDTKGAAFVVDELFVSRFLAGGPPLGTEVYVGSQSPVSPQAWGRIVGVVGRANLLGLEQRDGLPVIYTIMKDDTPSWGFTVFLHTSRSASALTQDIRAKMAQLDARLPLSKLEALEDSLGLLVMKRRAMTALFESFAGVTLVLALLGIYSVLICDVLRRKKEVAIRIAVGATRMSIVNIVLGHSMRKVGIGISLGVVFAAAASRYLGSVLFDVPGLDWTTYVSAVLAVVSMSLVASLVPAIQILNLHSGRLLEE